VGFVCLLCVGARFAPAQRDRREPLTEAQQDQLAEAGIDPGARIALYTKFASEHASRIEAFGKRTESGRGQRLESELEDFTALVDELASNLDQYGDRKADLRKGLKVLTEAVPKWQGILRGLPKEREDAIALEDATDSVNDLAAQTKELDEAQEKYFKEHKDRAGQEREEPQ
jgi:hypothetical protein